MSKTKTATATIDAFMALQAEALEIFKRKNADYGDSFRKDGVLGVMIRQKDKLNRFINLARKDGEGACKAEALRDTLLDLGNYALMAIIAHEEGKSWSGAERPQTIELDPELTSQDIEEISEFIKYRKDFRHMFNIEELKL